MLKAPLKKQTLEHKITLQVPASVCVIQILNVIMYEFFLDPALLFY